MKLRKFVIAVLALSFAAQPQAYAVSYKVAIELVILSEEVYGSDQAESARYCTIGVNDYKIAKGAPIKIKNGSGKIVGIGKLTKAFAVEDEGSFYCGYTGNVTVSSAKFYSIEIDGR